jgi:fused signal recognition particle receptor
MAEERKRGFFNRLFGVDTPPEAAEERAQDDAVAVPAPEPEPLTSPDTTLTNADGGETGTVMADGQPVPEFPPADDDEAMREALAAALPQVLEQLRTEAALTPPPPVAAASPAPKQSWFDRLRSGLSRSSQSLTSGITGVFTTGLLDSQTLDEFEDLLLQADLGVPTAKRIVDALAEIRVKRDVTMDEVRAVLAGEVEKVLAPVARPLEIAAGQSRS